MPISSSYANLTIERNLFNGDRNCSQSITSGLSDVNSNFTIKYNQFDAIQCVPIDVRGNTIKIIGNEINGYSSSTTDSTGMAVKGQNITISDNVLKNNGCSGIESQSTSSAVIKNNIVIGDGIGSRGIDIDGVSTGSIAVTNNHVTGNPFGDIRIGSGIPNVNFNVFDTYQGFTPSHLNVKSDGTLW